MKFPIVQNLSSLVFFVLFIFPSIILSQNFEYALSQQEFRESSVKTINITGDKIILGGGVGSCMSPAIWIFDTSGHYLSFQKLEVPYEYGFINDIKYDSITEQFYMVAPVLFADDVAGPSTMAFSFDSDFNLLQSKDLFPEIGSGSLAKYQFPYLLTEKQDSIIIFDKEFEEIHRIGYESNQYHTVDAWLVDSTLIIFQNSISSDARILRYNWDNQIIGNKNISNSSKVFLLKDKLFALGIDTILRKYSFPEIQLQDSTSITIAGRLEGGNSHENSFEIVSYLEDQAIIAIYDTNLIVIHEISSGLKGETEIQGIFYREWYYHSAKYYGYTPDHTLYPQSHSFIPFLRKIDPYDLEIDRASLSISNVRQINELRPINTYTAQNGSMIYQFELNEAVISEITVHNTTGSVINSFVIYKDILFSVNCARDNGYHYIDGLALVPGDSMTILDSTYVLSIESDRGLVYYVAAPNHMLSDSFYNDFALRDIVTSTYTLPRFESITFAPNPVLDYLSINLPSGISSDARLEIISIAGQKISQIKPKSNRIDIHYLSPGTYFIRLINRDKIYLGTFIKNE